MTINQTRCRFCNRHITRGNDGWRHATAKNSGPLCRENFSPRTATPR